MGHDLEWLCMVHEQKQATVHLNNKNSQHNEQRTMEGHKGVEFKSVPLESAFHSHLFPCLSWTEPTSDGSVFC